MRVISSVSVGRAALPADHALLHDLLGPVGDEVRLPPLIEVLGAALELAEGRRAKVIVPLSRWPAELVLVRRGEEVLLSYVLTGERLSAPVLDRALPLAAAIRRVAVSLGSPGKARAGAEGELLLRAERMSRALDRRARDAASVAPRRAAAPSPLRVQASTDAASEKKLNGARTGAVAPLHFGFEAWVHPLNELRSGSRTDAHALLFPGAFIVSVRGRKVVVYQGPIWLVVQRLLQLSRALLDAAEAGRGAHIRLREGAFSVTARFAQGAETGALTFGGGSGGRVSVAGLSVEDLVRPTTQLSTAWIRSLLQADRSQARNLCLSARRRQVREVRARLRLHRRAEPSLINPDPDRLRQRPAFDAKGPDAEGPDAKGPDAEGPDAKGPDAKAPSRHASTALASLRYEQKWCVSSDVIDPAVTYLCGDRLLVAAPRQVWALDRKDGSVLFSHRRPAVHSAMVGRSLLRICADGRVELCSVDAPEPYAEVPLCPPWGGEFRAMYAEGGSGVPMAIVHEGSDRIGSDRMVAIDLRDGQLRWRVAAGRPVRALARSGRVLLVGGPRTVTAIDTLSGDIAWRFATSQQRLTAHRVVRDRVVAVGPTRAGHVVYGIDLFSGCKAFERRLEAAAVVGPMAAYGLALFEVESAEGRRLIALDAATGDTRWSVDGGEPGSRVVPVDGTLVVHAPSGGVRGLSLADGSARWSHADLPCPDAAGAHESAPAWSRAAPVLRNGALFVPGSALHILRPQDGRRLSGDAGLPCDLMPHWMRVDERGWVYVAEESGHLAALAPASRLRLVCGPRP